MTENFLDIKRNYAEDNFILGEISMVTPSLKVVEYLAQFMVSQDLSLEDVFDRAKDMAFMESVVQYMRGKNGVSPRGFP